MGRPLAVPARWPSFRSGVRWSDDAVLAVVLGVGAIVGTSAAGPGTSPLGYALIATMFVPLAWRSTHPVVVVLLVATLAGAVWLETSDDWHTAAAGAITIYGLGRRVERPTSIRWFAVVLTGLVAAATVQVAITESDHDGWFPVVARGSLVLGAFWFGDAQQQRDQLLITMRDRAERAEEHRRVVERQAMLDERNRIARELHDVVAHSLSVMVVQATAAVRLADHDTPGSRQAMQSVADVGRTAMGEMRQILGLLDGEQALAPQPDLTDLADLIERYRRSGLDVALRRPDRLPRFGAPTELAVVRIVQEGLTNALKHVPGTAATVSMAVLDDRLVVEVVDTGPADPAARPTPPVPPVSSGRGLLGMRERVDALGGSLTAGPRPDGGFAVVARLPIEQDRDRP